MTAEFRAWPKTPRLFRDMVITEKIDGTNAAVIIEAGFLSDGQTGWCGGAFHEGTFYKVGAQSRKRIITPDEDNFGFAGWVSRNTYALVEALGQGTHYGEWWGSGIQRGYALTGGEKRFSLFNVHRYADVNTSALPELGLVPELYAGPFDTDHVIGISEQLRASGSHAAPGFADPEGVIVFHAASRQVYKVLLENDDIPKGLVA